MEFVPDIVDSASAPSCASEAIHVPGAIQPHGLLLLFDANSGGLAHWAGDFARLLGGEPSAGRTVENMLGGSLGRMIERRSLLDGGEPAYLGDLRPPNRPRLAILAHRAGDFLAVELQPAGNEGSATPALELVRAISDHIAASATQAEACSRAAAQVRSITGFDRVMIYRFLDDGSGSVIAEARAAKASAFFNHRFPSSDIPRQARDLYRRSLIRTIPDVAYCPSPIKPAPHLPVDMSHCVLRSVSPVHIQYLRNMDVGASMSISLLVEGELWGLIACHHHDKHPVPVEAQLLCRHVGMSLSAFILSCGQAEIALLDGLQRDGVETALRRLRLSSDPDRTLRTSAADLKGLIQCGGFALIDDGELIASAGRVPDADQLRALAPLVEAHLDGRDSYWTDRVGQALPGTPPIASTASGLMAVRVGASQPLLALWFRPEQVEEIEWAGDPSLKEMTPENLAPLTPRRSFATWRETVRGRSRPWLWYEISAADLFQSRAGFTLQRHRLKELNIQLAKANAGLSALAATDPLTGLPNRRLFDERLRVEWENALRQGQSLGLVAIDVDHFKQYNDCFGHPAGDTCLKQVAGAIESARRSIDVAARVGGEEFAILLPAADAKSAAAVAERVRRAIEQLGIEHPIASGSVVTASIGTAVGSPAETGDVSELMNRADRALYTAKADGRNRVAASD
jgi:diguanylate cyclase (GGDEF)-like protein